MIRTHLLRLFLALFVATQLAGAPAMAAPPEGKGKPGKTQKHDKGESTSDSSVLITAAITIEQARRLAISNNYTGYGALPPGIRKNLGRGKPLPPGIAKKAVPTPLLAQLPHHPGYEWQVCGSDLVLVAVATAIIADVLTGVFD
ncbi:MAG: RcnB family protein [Proteobacteria bacterium]|nr:RcnB family protein [Pseudomonadota bacterium]MBU1547563.1 RcnB family protein [Pseudomonadota bacterium]MBU2619845.1 RcnB family protein [Pseudomonadota bacterium]